MASNTADDWPSMAFRQRVLSHMYVFLYRLALSTNCYLAVLNVFFSSTCLASYFRFREEAVKNSGNPNVMMKNPSKMENQVYLKAKTRVCAHSLIVSLCEERFITCCYIYIYIYFNFWSLRLIIFYTVCLHL